MRDLLVAVRFLRKSPAFAAAAVLTLALGIGANAAVFSVIYWVLLRPLPFPDPDRLVLVSEYSPGNVAKTGSPLVRYRTRAESAVFEQTAAYWDVSGGNGLVFGANASAERLQFSIVTSAFVPILGVRPALGRAFTRDEDEPGANAKVFLASDALWRGVLAADRSALGKTFLLDGEPHTLIGVLPPDFHYPAECAIWLPVGALAAPTLQDRSSHQFRMLARLRPGIPLVRAQAEMDVIQNRLAQAYPASDANWRVAVRPLLEETVGNVRASLWILFAAVGCVLLIACANVVNLLLARISAREREFAIRVALGAGRARILRQSFAETFLLVACGSALALLFANAAIDALAALSAGAIPRFEQLRLSIPAVLFLAGTALASTLLVGLAPGLHASRLALGGSMRVTPRAGLRNALVVAEVAITVLLLSGGGGMLRSFQHLRHVDPGFQPKGVTAIRIALPDGPLYPGTAPRVAFLHQLLAALNTSPGIPIAAAADRLPLSGETNWGRINVEGRPPLDAAHAPSVEGRAISPNYFHAMGIPLLRGRTFTDEDVASQRRVVIVNRAMAERFWPGADPIGRRVSSAYRPDQPHEIVGIIENIKDSALAADAPAEIYTPYGCWIAMNLVLRSSLDPTSLFATVRAQAARLDRGVPVYDARPMVDVVDRSLSRQRFESLLLAVFAVLALVLSAVGIYGLLAFAVSTRTQEIGIRIALGAQPRSVLALVLSHGMKLVGAGLVAGTVASLALTRALAGLFYSVSPNDPLTLIAVSILLAVAGALACWIPARRALSVHPATALR